MSSLILLKLILLLMLQLPKFCNIWKGVWWCLGYNFNGLDGSDPPGWMLTQGLNRAQRSSSVKIANVSSIVRDYKTFSPHHHIHLLCITASPFAGCWEAETLNNHPRSHSHWRGSFKSRKLTCVSSEETHKRHLENMQTPHHANLLVSDS